MSNTLSYATILKDRDLFRKAGSKSGDSFNYTDTPATKYFKVFFYFRNGDSDNNLDIEQSTGLLAPTWLINPDQLTDRTYYRYNSAWSYLKMNYEDERADLLIQFVNLLSNISSKSPWYFSELSGLETALERKIYEKEFKIVEEERKKISIKCLPDAYDDRISTLLDLYRSIIWSWKMKREVIPSNLRKFDMGIFIFNDPVMNFSRLIQYPISPTASIQAGSGKLKDSSALKLVDNRTVTTYDSEMTLDKDKQCDLRSSYKYIEFHNCEFDYNSIKSGLANINNKEGLSPEYTIDISFDDCYEYSFNEFNMEYFGDIIAWDLWNGSGEYTSQNKGELGENTTELNTVFGVDSKLNNYDDKNGVLYEWLHSTQYEEGEQKGFLTNAFDQLIGTGKNIATGLIKKAVLGNLYTFSLTRLNDQVKSLSKGNIWSAIRNVNEYVNDAKQRKENQLEKALLFEKPKKIFPTVKKIGNIFNSQTIANNV